MNDKQTAFIDAYMTNGFNATQAAITAGYSPKTAQEQSSRLLSNVIVREEIERRQKEARERYDVTMDDIMATLKVIILEHGMGAQNPIPAIKAIDIVNKMKGHYAIQKQEITHKGININYVKPTKKKDEEGEE